MYGSLFEEMLVNCASKLAGSTSFVDIAAIISQIAAEQFSLLVMHGIRSSSTLQRINNELYYNND